MKSEEFKKMIRQVVKEELRAMQENHLKPAEDHKTPHLDPHLAHEEICEGEGCLDEKSVPQPYNRKGAKKMTKGQIERRQRIGKEMLGNEKTVGKFRKQYGQDWKDYLWAAASAAAMRSGS